MAEVSYYLCRLCAFKCLMPGTMVFSAEGLLNDIPRKIHECLQLTISEDDKFPKIICRDCMYKLDLSYEFKAKSLASQHFLSELFKHDVLGNDLITKDVLQNQEFQCLGMNDDLTDQSAIQELEHLVDEAHLQADSSDISKIIQYHDSDISEYQIQQIEHNISTDIQKDTMSLPDITLYTFDSISDAGVADNPDILTVPDFEMSMLNSSEMSLGVSNGVTNKQSTNGGACSSTDSPADSNLLKTSKKELKECNHCRKKFATNYKLKEHERTHSNEKPFHCTKDGCSKTFRSKIGLQQHEAKHAGKFKFACGICGKGFEIKSYLTIHLKTHDTTKAFKCSMCDLTFKAKQGLIDHENRHLGLKPYECSLCHRRFITKSLCLSHYQTHSDTIKREHQCEICTKYFATKSCLKMHTKIHFDDKQHVCGFCGKGFLARTDLKLHETSHTGEKFYTCETCGKQFNRPNALNNHLRLHTGERPYKCKYCPQSFAQNSPMRIHMRLHTGERPYACANCPRSFVSRTSLQRHQRTHIRTQQNGSGCSNDQTEQEFSADIKTEPNQTIKS